MKLPFTPEQFFSVFEKYNIGVYPFQWLLFLIGCLVFCLLPFRKSNKTRIAFSYVAFLWLWAGAVYFINFFSEITGMAFFFGAIFILEGCLILHHLIFSNLPAIPLRLNLSTVAGYLLILFSLLIYPLTEYLKTGSHDRILFIGLPCPTTLLTFGLFMICAPGLPKSLLPIPTAWAVISLFAAIHFGMYQDSLLLIAAFIINIKLWNIPITPSR